jgi:hypothetical protein
MEGDYVLLLPLIVTFRDQGSPPRKGCANRYSLLTRALHRLSYGYIQKFAIGVVHFDFPRSICRLFRQATLGLGCHRLVIFASTARL